MGEEASMSDSAGSFVFLTRNGIADPGQDDKLADLRRRLEQNNAKLLLHLHGGLVDEKDGIGIATRLMGSGEGSWDLDDEWTQVYVVWRTGALETLRTNWQDLAHNDRLYQAILRKLISFVTRKLGIGAGGNSRSAYEVFSLDEDEIHRRITGRADKRRPFADVEERVGADVPPGARASLTIEQSNGALVMEFEDELLADNRFQAAVADIDGFVNEGVQGRAALAPADRQRGLASHNRLSAAIQGEMAPSLARDGSRGVSSVLTFLLKHAGKIALRCFRRFRNGRDHGLHATIVEELCRELYGDLIGSALWGMMVKDAGDHFEKNGFGSQLIGVLPRTGAVVTAHSAGSIWAARLLLAMHSAGIQIKVNLFLLAPAVRHSLFAEMIGQAGALVGQCRMYTMSDELERRDAVLGRAWGFIYPSSLLYLVSGICEEHENQAYPDAPLVGMQRFSNPRWLTQLEQDQARTVGSFFEQPGNDIVYSPAAGICIADCHGCFDDEPLTLKSAKARF